MTNFTYRVKTKEGEIKEGKENAEDKNILAKKLREGGDVVLSITEERKSLLSGRMDKINAALSRVNLKEKIIFTNNLGTMIEAGLPLARALTVIGKQTKNPKLKEILESLITDVNKGLAFNEGLTKFPKVFPGFYVAMIRAGEESGKLPETLKIVASQLEKSYELKRKIRGAMIYPSIIISLIIVIAVLMMLFVVPTLSDTFSELGAELPATTRFILGISDFLSAYIFIILPVFIVFVGLFIRLLKTKKGIYYAMWVVLHMPVFKEITKQANAAITMRTISSLVSSGVSMVHALEITEDVIQNPHFKRVLSQAKQEVQKGTLLSAIFERNAHLYPILVAEMIDVGEETGQLSQMLEKGAIFYEGEVDAVTKNLSTIIEPFLMILIGGAVGFFALAMIQPMYSIGDFL